MGEYRASKDVDAYIAGAKEPRAQEMMAAIRAVVREEAPSASEKISWEMPSFMDCGSLVQFAAHTRHLGFYPGPSAIEHFQEALKDYKTTKGAIQFPYDRPLDMPLVRMIVRFRVMENHSGRRDRGKGL